MKTIAFDVMGGDLGIRPAIEAVLEFIKKHLDYYFLLVGDREQIEKYVRDNERIQIVDIKNTVSHSAKIRDAFRLKTSMSTAIDFVKSKKAHAVLSAGNSAVYLMQTTLILKRIKGVIRPAFMPLLPTIKPNKRFVMIDVGANSVSTSEMLEQWALMGHIFAKSILKIEKPKIAILTIGTEENKGIDIHIKANQELKKKRDLNYVGYLEPRNILDGEIDVVICDGYGGNLVLKTIEGTAMSVFTIIKNTINSKLRYKLGAFFVKKALKKVKEQTDHRNIGGAWIIGIDGIAIKAHGSSDKKAYYGALKQIDEALEKDYLVKFCEAFNRGN